jgi:peptidoglycan/xylan/chitin deacetylase (PgdA/CDA1 family)
VNRLVAVLTAIRKRLARITAQQVAFGVPAVTAVLISAVFSLRGTGEAAPDPRRFSGSNIVMGMPSLLRTAKLPERFVVAIVRDHEAANFYDSPATLDTIIGAWRRSLADAGALVRVVRPSEIRSANARVLVVPSSPCLSLQTREAIDMAGARGHGLIVSGPTGTHDAGCRKLGYGLLVALTGASRVEHLDGRPMVYATIPAEGPLGADIPPGARLNIAPAAQIALRTPRRDVFYSDYTLGAAPADGAPYLDAAVVRGTYRGARVAYFGFELRDISPSAWHREVLRILARNAAAWAAGTPVASIASWPQGFESAAVIAHDVESRFPNARHAVDTLKAIGVRSTFFVTSNLADDNRRLTHDMAAIGEVGTHSENHSLLGGTPFEQQLERLALTRQALGHLVDGGVRGLRPPEEQFDEATMAAWLAAGGQYLLGANDSRCAAPELLRIRNDTLVLVPRVFADDFAAAGPEYRRAPHLVTAIMRKDMHRAREVNGLYVLSYHSQLLSRPAYVSVLATLARELAAEQRVWVATADEVAEWWQRRALIQAEVVGRTTDHLELRIRNQGDRRMDSVVVSVTLPNGRRARPAAGVLSADGVARVTLRSLPPWSRVSVRVLLD